MTIKIVGELEVDIERGVLYFHNYTNGLSTLRICGLRDKLTDFSVKSQLDVTIPLVMRSEMEGLKQPQKVGPYPEAPKTFFLNEQHTTHVTKAQRRTERAVKKLSQKILARADHLLKPSKKEKSK